MVEEYVEDKGLPVRVMVCAIEDRFVQQGTVAQLRHVLGLDADSLYDRIEEKR